jgi:two-component system NtrC family response regulator
MAAPTLLIVEDDEGLCGQYRWAFPGHRVVIAQHRAEALRLAQQEQPAVAITDLGLPPDPDGVSEGFAVLAGLQQLSPAMKIIVATGNDARAHALRAVAEGAYDFYTKPIDIEVLRTIVGRAFELHQLQAENQRLASLQGQSSVRNIVTANEAMVKLCRNIERLAATNVPVLLLGESGTGKEALARGLHELGPRARQPFVAINCGAIPETLLESELFGHERGAFTGAVKQTIGKIESAHHGTLFLDEIGDLAYALQVKLLRFLQDQVIERVGGRQQIKVDVRIVSATNQALDSQISEGKFRSDLLYRLDSVTLRIPPLRERAGDAVLLARFFLARANQEYNRAVRGFTPAALAALAAHPWPGNVRELESRVKRAVVMADDVLIDAGDMELAAVVATPDFDLRAARLRAEREVVQLALAHSHGKLSLAAKLLGISRPTLYTLLESLGIGAHGQAEATEIGGNGAGEHEDA